MKMIINVVIGVAFGFLIGFPFGISYTVTAAQDSDIVKVISNIKAMWEFFQ
jgi:Sec-independent protein secretion pathway component TatC